MHMRKSTIALLTVTSAVALACGSGGDDAGSTDTGSSTTSTADGSATAKVGQPVRDGKFEFTVQKVKCGVARVGGEFGEKAQGQFCLVTISVKNIGDEAQYLADSDQKAYDAKGTEYSTDSGAALHANNNADTFLNQINPGNSVNGVLVFDVPKTVKLTRLELHDSAFSSGVTVRV